MKLSKEEKIKAILQPGQKYTIQNRTFCFLDCGQFPQSTSGHGLLGRIQNLLKKYGKLYYTLLHFFKPVLFSRSARWKIKELLTDYGEGHVILNLGSGPLRLAGRKDIINVDIFFFDQVDIVSDASDLMIKDESVDLIINFAMLEHVSDPVKVTDEIHRVLRKRGRIFCFLPFMQPYHAAPDDFYRWTISGIKILFSNFNDVEVFIGAGPTSGLLWVFQEWFAILCSFGNKTVHDIIFLFLMVVTVPIKLLDIFLERLPNAENIASAFFVIAKK